MLNATVYFKVMFVSFAIVIATFAKIVVAKTLSLYPTQY